MLRPPFAAFPAARRRRAVGLLAVATTAQLRVFLVFEREMKRTGGPGIIPFELAGSTERVREILGVWGARGRRAARSSLLLDYVFPPTYASLQALACSGTAVGFHTRGRRLAAPVATLIAWSQPAAAAFDYVENTALLLALAGRDQTTPRVARSAALAKFALITVGQGCILAGAIDGALGRRRS